MAFEVAALHAAGDPAVLVGDVEGIVNLISADLLAISAVVNARRSPSSLNGSTS
jgi:hypothetical protein